MTRITEELLRKRSEHNEEVLAELREISLHQLEIEAIENLGHFCKKLEILLLQNNLIPRIENLHKLKCLEYVNFALNNIETVENLERCESLRKLDLTANFIKDLTCFERLAANEHLRELYCTGNPCTKDPDYRKFVVAVVPQLRHLDSQEITKSERIQAMQDLPAIRQRLKESGTQIEEADLKYTPEVRNEAYQEIIKSREAEEAKAADDKGRIEVVEERQHGGDGDGDGDGDGAADGEPRFYQKNEGRWDFVLTEDDQAVFLDVPLGKHMSSTLVDADVQPDRITVTIKGKVLRLKLPEEVNPDAAKAQRSQITGRLLVTMPKVGAVVQPLKAQGAKPKVPVGTGAEREGAGASGKAGASLKGGAVNVRTIVADNEAERDRQRWGHLERAQAQPVEPSPGFVDDPDVPPLE